MYTCSVWFVTFIHGCLSAFTFSIGSYAPLRSWHYQLHVCSVTFVQWRLCSSTFVTCSSDCSVTFIQEWQCSVTLKVSICAPLRLCACHHEQVHVLWCHCCVAEMACKHLCLSSKCDLWRACVIFVIYIKLCVGELLKDWSKSWEVNNVFFIWGRLQNRCA